MKFLVVVGAYLGVAQGLDAIFGPWIAGVIVGVATVVIVAGGWWWMVERETPPVSPGRPQLQGPVIDVKSRSW